MNMKKNKKEEKFTTCPICDEEILEGLTQCPGCDFKFEEKDIVDKQINELEEKEEISNEIEEPPTIKKTGLIIGVLLSFAGIIGVIGLRTGFIQSLLGDSSPYPGIGATEPIGHIISVIPTVLGLVIIMSWGIKNDSIYYELEKSKKEDIHDVDDELEDVEEDVNIEEPTYVEEPASIEEESPEEIMPVEKEAPKELAPVKDDIPKVIAPVKDKTSEEITKPSKLKKKSEDDTTLDDLNEIFDDIEKEVEVKKEPIIVPASVKKEISEDIIRTKRCEKMLKAASILPEDKERLKELIPTGISAAEFTKQIRKAIEKRKKHDELKKDVTADEKASILEDEMVAELAELEDELEEGREKDDLEEQIFKELEDLENF